MENSYIYLYHPENSEMPTATDTELDLFGTDSDSEQSHARESQRSEEEDSEHKINHPDLSFSIHGFRSVDISLLDEDEIPTRDAGPDISFTNSNNVSRTFGSVSEDESNQVRSTLCSQEGQDQNYNQQNETISFKKKKTKSKGGTDREVSKNNNSLHLREKVRRSGNQRQHSVVQQRNKPEQYSAISVGPRRPSTWEMENPFELQITPYNVDTMLISARFYNQSDVIGLCKNTLLNCDYENALYCRFISEKHELADIIPFMLDYVRVNFNFIVKTHSFLGLNLQQLKCILTDDGILVQSELDVFNAARAWIDHSKHDRIKLTKEVMGCIRFIHMSPEDIVRYVEPDSYYFQGPGGKEVLLSIYRYHALNSSQSDLTALNVDMPPPRNYVPLGMDRPYSSVKASIQSRLHKLGNVTEHSSVKTSSSLYENTSNGTETFVNNSNNWQDSESASSRRGTASKVTTSSHLKPDKNSPVSFQSHAPKSPRRVSFTSAHKGVQTEEENSQQMASRCSPGFSHTSTQPQAASHHSRVSSNQEVHREQVGRTLASKPLNPVKSGDKNFHASGEEFLEQDGPQNLSTSSLVNRHSTHFGHSAVHQSRKYVSIQPTQSLSKECLGQQLPPKTPKTGHRSSEGQDLYRSGSMKPLSAPSKPAMESLASQQEEQSDSQLYHQRQYSQKHQMSQEPSQPQKVFPPESTHLHNAVSSQMRPESPVVQRKIRSGTRYRDTQQPPATQGWDSSLNEGFPDSQVMDHKDGAGCTVHDQYLSRDRAAAELITYKNSCHCSCSTEPGSPPVDDQLVSRKISEEQLIDLEKRVQKRKKDIAQKSSSIGRAGNKAYHQEGPSESQNKSSPRRPHSRTSVPINYSTSCKVKSHPPVPSPRKLKFSEDYNEYEDELRDREEVAKTASKGSRAKQQSRERVGLDVCKHSNVAFKSEEEKITLRTYDHSTANGRRRPPGQGSHHPDKPSFPKQGQRQIHRRSFSQNGLTSHGYSEREKPYNQQSLLPQKPVPRPRSLSPVKRHHINPSTQYRSNNNAPDPQINTNIATEPEEALIAVVGGLNPYNVDPEIPCRLVELYDTTSKTCILLTKLPEPRHHHGCVILDGYLYVIGGSVVLEDDLYNMCNATNSCYRYDFGGNYWTAVASMRYPRMYHSVALLEGVIYAIGGETSSLANRPRSFLDSCEYYNADTDEWGPIASLMDGIIGAAMIGFKGLLWVLGGYMDNGEESIVLATVDCYNPRTNSWLTGNPLPIPICHATAAEVLGNLFLIGGSTMQHDKGDPVLSLDHILRYMEEDDLWVQYETLAMPRHDADCCVVGSRLYILGGVCSMSKAVLNDIECLDLATGEWLQELGTLNSPALGLAAIAIKAQEIML